MRVEFLYFDGCPNQEKAFQLLQSVLKERKIESVIERIGIRDDEDAIRLKFVGSPTIRINGNDIDPIKDSHIYVKKCRTYKIHGVYTRLPSREMIEQALESAELAKGKQNLLACVGCLLTPKRSSSSTLNYWNHVDHQILL